MRSVRQSLLFFPISILVTYGFAPGDLSFGNRAKIDSSRYHRKPRNYWRDLENVTVELRSFWAKVNVNVDEHELPPIPNEAILNHFGRNDLRWAIVTQGGLGLGLNMNVRKCTNTSWNNFVLRRSRDTGLSTWWCCYDSREMG